ncbi:MAG: hypothetical protein KF868_03250 [Acidobacteria bacterium]|nr:hypothetical protein [Acidobacteriota bacterium]MCW5967240.1 hypothetical protein [Blastocatellales bacterium]
MRCLYYLLLSVCLGATMSLAASAQTPAPDEPAQQVQTQESGELRKRPGNATLEEGSQARLSLQTSLSSKLNEVGDPIEAVLYEPLRDAQGRVLVPRGTEFFGRITHVQAAKRPQKQATMTIVFETMRMPYGAEKISTVVTAIDDYANDEKYRSKDDEGKVGAGKSGGRTAENAGRGAGLGGVGGLIVVAAGGGLGGLATAVGVGAAGGVLMTKGNDIRLAPGTILRIRFERDVQIPVTEP